MSTEPSADQQAESNIPANKPSDFLEPEARENLIRYFELVLQIANEETDKRN